MKTISLSASAVVLLIGASGSGKSTFAARHFPAELITSSDHQRGLIAGDASDQGANDVVFERMHQAVEERAAAGILTVIDATNTRGPARSELGWHAHRHHRPLVAIVMDVPVEICLQRNAARIRPVPNRVILQQVADLRHLEADLELEGYAAVHVFRSEAEVDATRIVIESDHAKLG
jgi:protein phosphatase